VAAHFTALGGKADFVSAVGGDDLGKAAVAEIKKRAIGHEHLTVSPYPTGFCKVTLQKGTPSYDLANDVAYDHISLPLPIDGKDYGALYYGTLACRNEESLDTLEKLFSLCEERFYDINIRPPFYSRALLRHLLFKATTLKISREEAEVLCPYHDPAQYLYDVANAFPNIKKILLTLDKDGSVLFDTASERILYGPKPLVSPLSTVGAGDAFSACYLYHTFKNSDPETTLLACGTLADFVITQLGAVPHLPEELKKRLV
jgi:fructokinase